MPRLAVVALSIALAYAATTAPAGENPMVGFSSEHAAEQRAWETKLDALVRAENLRGWMQQMTAHPHHVGSPWDKANAEMMAGLFESWGYETKIEEFWVLFPTPKERKLELLAPTSFVASLKEDVLAEDRTSAQVSEYLPTYNAYSVDGDVTGELVYVNYGLPADYEELAKNGVSVEGKIVLARYGGSWRGIKPKVAAEHGAIGCIIFSDPGAEGYGAGDVYPKGGFRPAQGVQRGSVADAPLRSGDPLTPFVGARKDAKRLPREEADTLTKIPTLPISARDAQPLLAALGGRTVPREWRGGLPLAYHFGPGPAKVHLKVAFNWDLKPLYDVTATLRGSERPDEWVIRGNHHDAWVAGATDPVSGMVAVLEEARVVGELAKQGMRPKRTIVYAAWDGEEPGLLGSTEWAETYASELAEKAAVYINSDSNSAGFFGLAGSHTLETLLNQVATDVQDPDKGITVAARRRAQVEISGSPDEAREAKSGAPLRLEALGSGSDFTPFLQHVGVASLNVDYGGEGDYGQYHSIYDSFDHYVRFMDTDFRYGAMLAKTAGRVTLRLANADVLPFEPASLTRTLGEYVTDLVKLTDRMRDETAEENRRLSEGLYQAVAPKAEPIVLPAPKEAVPFLNFAPLENAMEVVKASTERYDKARSRRLSEGPALSLAEAQRLDQALMGLERSLLRSEGLPGRPWYRHQIYAPGNYTGYGVKTMPSVREAIELRRWDEASQQIEVVAGVLRAYAAQVDSATAVLAP